MLHTVNKSPFQNGSLESCLRCVGSNDVVLLLEDGVFAASSGTGKSALIEQTLPKVKGICAIAADVKARGLTRLIPGVTLVDYEGFVDLVAEHSIHAWL
jgi:tRNA 2-thiouridine synthesizing protein B